VKGLSAHDRLRVSLVLSSFEAAMPLIGMLLGRAIGSAIGAAADYLAIGILALVGVWMLLSDDESEERSVAALPGGHGLALIGLGLSVSIDELAMGFSIGLLHLPIWLAVALIGAQAFVVAQLGMRLGARGTATIGERAERLAGIALLGLALLLIIDRLVT
jgi:putative Mn2+ efflux pump MntP